MATRTTPSVSAVDARHRLEDLLHERSAARRSVLGHNATYMADLEADIAVSRAAYVAAAVLELVLLRGAALGRLQG